MKSPGNLSIRSKLTLIVMATSCTALIVASVALGVYDQLSFRANLLQDVVTRAEIIGNNSTAALSFGDPRPVEETLGALSADPHLVAAAVYDSAGNEFARYDRAGGRSAAPPKPAAASAQFINGNLDVWHSIHFRGERLGMVFLRSDLAELRARRERTIGITALVLVVAAGVAFLLASGLQHLISRPLLRLLQTTNAVAINKDYGIRVPKNSDDELGRLIDGFNEMLSQVQTRDVALQRAQAELEQRVAGRTRELAEANDSLKSEVTAHKHAREESEHLSGQLEAAFEHLQRQVVERSEVQEALRRSEERFSKAFKASPVPLAILTRRGGAFVDANDAFAGLAGRPRDEIIGRTLFEMPLWSAGETRARLEKLLAAGEPLRNCECRIGGESETGRAALLSAEAFELGSEPCVLLMTQDISERVNLEAQLRQAQKMEAIGQLASGVAHDFNNLLTIIQGHTQLVLTTQPCTGKGREALQKVINASQRAGQLTRQLLTFSRKQLVQLRTLDLNQIVDNIRAMLGPLLGEGVRLHWKPMANLPSIEADAGMLEQVVVNLAVNARDAMARGGDLILSTVLYEIDASYVRCQPQARAGRFVCLQVSDSGCGMDAGTLEHIFEPFFTTKGVGKGTGLGLATVYGIVKQHRGWVEVVSQVGMGTTFKIFLPVASVATVQAERGTDPGITCGGNETILVVEDEPLLRELVTEILRGFGYSVLEATHGKDALALWQRTPRKIDLLLTDMMMPEGMTGWELAEQLRARAPDLKVVYTSGYSTELFGRDLQLDDRANFIAKPYNPRTLATAVRECLDR
ncbi:MAG TPA: ATP-binding protein [Verrucomicrobiae bacterium]|jgi:PAS domain S-box-containing protein